MHGFDRQFSQHFHKIRGMRNKNAEEMKKQGAHLSDTSAAERQACYENGGHPHHAPSPSHKERGFESHSENDV
jgi:hypothetical protein